MAAPYLHATGSANKPERGFGRTIYYPQLRPLLREKNYTFNITDTPYGGNAALKRKGNVLQVEIEPYVKAMSYVPGQPLQTQSWKRKTIEFSPNRRAYIQVASTPEQDHFSPYNVRSTLMASGGLSFIERVQLECVDFMISNVPSVNTGAVATGGDIPIGCAGRVSGSYLLGSPNRPIILKKTLAEKTASTATGPKAIALELVKECNDVICEQTTADLVVASPMFCIAPQFVWSRAELALATQGEPTKSTDSSWWFAGTREVIDTGKNLGGFDYMYSEHRLKPHSVASSVTGYAPAGTVAYPIVFGRRMAVAHDEEFDVSESEIKSQQNFDSVDRRMWLYDFFALYPVLLGVAWVTPNDYDISA